MHEVFISYKSEDYDLAQSIRRQIEEAGVSCWMAPDSIPGGSNYTEQIPNAIRNARFFVLILSELAQNSKYVLMELSLAVQMKKSIFPVFIEDCALSDSLAFLLSRTQRYTAFTDRDEAVQSMTERMKLLRPDPSPSRRTKMLRWLGRAGTALSLVWLIAATFWDAMYYYLTDARLLIIQRTQIIFICVLGVLILPNLVAAVLKKRRFRMYYPAWIICILMIALLPQMYLPHTYIKNNTLLYITGYEKTNEKLETMEGVSIIGPGALSGNIWVDRPSLPDSVTTIEKEAFSKSNISLLSLSDNVQQIGDAAFKGCLSLQYVDLPKGLEQIGDSLFEDCASLKTVFFPDSVKSIGKNAFSGCTCAHSFRLPDSVEEIRENAFRNCILAEYMIFGSKLRIIGKGALDGQVAVREYYVNTDNPYFMTDADGVLFTKDGKTLVHYPAASRRTTYTVPETVTDISDGAFSFCRNLTELVLPEGLQRVGADAFADSFHLSMGSVRIPPDVQIVFDDGLS